MNKSAASRRKAVVIAAPSVVEDSEAMPDPAGRTRHIAEAAYFKAEARGFVPGLQMDDWLEAETEYDAALEEA